MRAISRRLDGSWCDPHRFANGSKLASYAGLAPTHRRFGTTLNTAIHNRAGNKRLKTANAPSRLHHHATMAKTTVPPSPPSPADVAHIILTMIKTQTSYNPHHQPNTT